MRLDEITASTSVPWQWVHLSDESAKAEFKIGSIDYYFTAISSDNDHYDNDFDSLGNDEDDFDDDKYSGYWLIEFSAMRINNKQSSDSDSIGVTNTGNSASVASAITDIMKDFIKRYNDQINVIEFDAHEASRKNVYTRVLSRLLPNWKQQHGNQHDIEFVRPVK